MLKELALSRFVMSMLEIRRHPMTLFTITLCTRKPTPCSCLSSFPLKYTPVTPSCRNSTELFHLISHNPRMLHMYRSISCKSSSNLPTALMVLTFHVSMVLSVCHQQHTCRSRPRVRRGMQSLCAGPVWIFYHSLLSFVVCLVHIFILAVPTPLQTAGL